jgi:hypothetical protein
MTAAPTKVTTSPHPHEIEAYTWAGSMLNRLIMSLTETHMQGNVKISFLSKTEPALACDANKVAK